MFYRKRKQIIMNVEKKMRLYKKIKFSFDKYHEMMFISTNFNTHTN